MKEITADEVIKEIDKKLKVIKKLNEEKKRLETQLLMHKLFMAFLLVIILVQLCGGYYG